MSKETNIVFIYDLKKLEKEEDDPATAILYFHPSWVSDHQKTVLCGQLVGIIHCLKKVFSEPKIISLESGKFLINNIDERYLLAVGTDRNVADWILLHRCELLTSLIKFYHKDIEEIAQIYGNVDALSAKIYHMCETYLKIISFGGNIFTIIPTISLPKSASNVFIETLNILQYCQTLDHVLGGLILHHNKVVATQLPPLLTKKLVLTDPYRIKSPAETITTTFHLPIGTQLLQVYIEKSERDYLLRNSKKIKNLFNENGILEQKCNDKLLDLVPTLKRDCSLLFTAVPEEDNEMSPNKNEDATIIRLKKPTRPKFLNLKSKISDIKEVVTSNVKTPYTPFTGNSASVISTPMTELNKVLHVNIYSICTDPDPEEQLVGNTVEMNNKEIRKRSNSMTLMGNKEVDFKLNDKYKTISDPTDLINEVDYKNLSAIRNEFLALKQAKKNIATITKQSSHDSERESHEKSALRKNLKLPLKSLSQDSGYVQHNSDAVSSGLLTPLMQKLSSLAFEAKSSGISSFTPTPLEYKDVVPLFSKKANEKSKSRDDSIENDDNYLVKCILFICGQQDTVFEMLLEPEAAEKESLINSLWEVCTKKLGVLEKQLHQCLEPYSGNTVPEQEPYSFLCLDKEWDTLKRGGPWDTGETMSISILHRDFQKYQNITEILCKGNDSILYGVHLGDSEIFYHQSEGVNNGLPTPSDSMGHVPMRAKRSLERDHSIVLL